MQRLFWPQQQQPEHAAAVLGEQDGSQGLMHGRRRLSLYLHRFAKRPRVLGAAAKVASPTEEPPGLVPTLHVELVQTNPEDRRSHSE
jgi:hypothetical protein